MGCDHQIRLGTLPDMQAEEFGHCLYFRYGDAARLIVYKEDGSGIGCFGNDHIRLDSFTRTVKKIPPGLYAPIPEEIFLKDPFKGWLYAVATNPDLSLHRLKVGWTSKPVERLIDFRTADPNALLLGLWQSFPAIERKAHSAIRGRIRDSEVFDVDDPWKALRTLNKTVEKFNSAYLVADTSDTK
jgi:hypothetical protein